MIDFLASHINFIFSFHHIYFTLSTNPRTFNSIQMICIFFVFYLFFGVRSEHKNPHLILKNDMSKIRQFFKVNSYSRVFLVQFWLLIILRLCEIWLRKSSFFHSAIFEENLINILRYNTATRDLTIILSLEFIEKPAMNMCHRRIWTLQIAIPY